MKSLKKPQNLILHHIPTKKPKRHGVTLKKNQVKYHRLVLKQFKTLEVTKSAIPSILKLGLVCVKSFNKPLDTTYLLVLKMNHMQIQRTVPINQTP